ncbi:hypothetical protein M231_06186 [Tremella mesenterica]|uniref:Fe2OG dioxygenase domain-containing protein n=1 Tax=Tremella mesenterica TaxID=5217 RepID=A0A4Q1BDY3_TREME|nr:hypothetical protein M231_06186 [Tremella mesenterica]
MSRKHRKPGSLDVRSEPVWRPIGCLNQVSGVALYPHNRSQPALIDAPSPPLLQNYYGQRRPDKKRDAPDGLVRNPKPLKDPEQKMNDLVSEWVDQPMRTISASEANIIPSCGSSSRSKDDNRSYHAGIWHPPTQSDVPFYSKDALQFPIKAMMSAFAKIAGRGARQALQKYDRDVYVRLTHTHFLSPFLADYSKGDLAMTKAELVDLKLGRVGTMLAIADGQSEGWHFDRGDDDDTYSVVFVFGEGGWDTSEKQGNLVIPQLNLEFELNVGDVLFFQASHLLHYVLPLNPEDTDKRIVLTVFTCKRLSNHFKRYGFPRPSV